MVRACHRCCTFSGRGRDLRLNEQHKHCFVVVIVDDVVVVALGSHRRLRVGIDLRAAGQRRGSARRRRRRRQRKGNGQATREIDIAIASFDCIKVNKKR